MCKKHDAAEVLQELLAPANPFPCRSGSGDAFGEEGDLAFEQAQLPQGVVLKF